MDIRWKAVQLNLQSWNVENLVVLDCDQLIRWGDGLFLVGGDKEQLLKQVYLVRDSPSEPLYRERVKSRRPWCKRWTSYKLRQFPGLIRQKLESHDINPLLARALVEIVPGNSLSTPPNWKDCAFRWVFAFRKNLPTTKGCNQTGDTRYNKDFVVPSVPRL